MTDYRQFTPRILVTTDFSDASERAFFHALALAVRLQARLTLLHTGAEGRDSVPWDRFPGVRQTLTKWGLLAPDAPRSAIAESLHVGVAKMAIRDDARNGITDYLRRNPTDLLVMATEGRTGIARLFRPSVADSVCRATRSRTLMLPKSAGGFVDPDTGRSTLKRVAWIFDAETDPHAAMTYLRGWLPMLAADEGLEIVALRVGDTAQAPPIVLPQSAGGVSWREESAGDDPVSAATRAARELGAGLVALQMHDPVGPWKRMRGSRTDKILRELQLPLLTLPAA
ncbi:MAG: universal stress protein [Gammaproteobacteria bacterium]|nr:universal stress protein [Gammaproteobacteria bacterium]